MQRKSKFANTQVPSLQSVQNLKNMNVRRQSLTKRETKASLLNVKTNNDLKNVRNMPAIQGSSINTITGGRGTDHFTNNSDLQKISLSGSSKRHLQENKSPAHTSREIVHFYTPNKQNDDKQATRNLYGVRVFVDDQSLHEIPSGAESVTNKDQEKKSNKMLSDRAHTLKQTTIDQVSQMGVIGSNKKALMANSAMGIHKPNLVTRIGQKELFHSHQSTSQLTDGESDQQVMRAASEIRTHKQPSLPTVSGVPILALPKPTAEHGTDVKSIPQTATRMASADSTIVEHNNTTSEKQEIANTNRENLKTSSTAGDQPSAATEGQNHNIGQEASQLVSERGGQIGFLSNTNGKPGETGMNTVHLQEMYAESAPDIVLLLQDKPLSPTNQQLVEIEQMRASLIKVQKKGSKSPSKTNLHSKHHSSQRSITRRGSMPDQPVENFIICEDGTKLVGQEAQMTQKALLEYKRKKHRLMKNRRVFGDSKIATIDNDTKKRTQQIANLLGNTKEARDIQESFKKMIEVPQEDFNLENYKELTQELRNKVKKPAPIYYENLKMNPKHIKKLSTIEDFVTVLPTSAESNYRIHQDSSQSEYHQHISVEGTQLSQQTDQQLALPEADTLLMIQAQDQQATMMHLEEHQHTNEDENGGNTFITNMVAADSATLQTQPLTAKTTMHHSNNRNNNQNDIEQTVLPDISKGGSMISTLATPIQQNSNRVLKGQVTTTDTTSSAVRQQQSSVFNKASAGGQKSVSTNEYQLMPVIESANQKQQQVCTGVTKNSTDGFDYRNVSAGSMLLQKTGDHKSQNCHSVAVFTPAKNQRQNNQDIVPFQSDQMLRENHQSEISFAIARSIFAETQGTKTQKKPAYRHSTLKSALGKESRVLKQIYKRVENFQKKEDDGSRLGYVQGMVEIYKQMTRDHDSNQQLRTSQFRKQSLPLMPIFVGQELKSKHLESQRDPSLNPLTYDNNSFNSTDEGHNSPTLADSRRLTQNEARRSSGAELHIIDNVPKTLQKEQIKAIVRSSSNKVAVAGVSVASNEEQSQFITLQTQRDSHMLKPWHMEEDNLKQPLTLSNPALLQANFSNKQMHTPAQRLLTQRQNVGAGGETLAQKRIHNQTMLNQYKQRRTLVSNLQISKLIRKDTSYFTGSARQIGDRKVTNIQSQIRNPQKKPVFDRQRGEKRNSNPVEANQFDRHIEINELFRPLNSQLDLNSGQKQPFNFNLSALPEERINVRIPQINKDANNISTQNDSVGTQQRNSFVKLARVRSVVNDESNKQLIRSAFDKTPLQHVSGIETSINEINSSSPMEKSVYKTDRTDNIQQEMNEYYRSLNAAARNQLSKVVIRGKNILETTNFISHISANEHRQGTQMLNNKNGDDSRLGYATEMHHRAFQENNRGSSRSTSHQHRQTHTPISVHIEKQDGQNVVAADKTTSKDTADDHESAHTEQLMQLQSSQFQNQLQYKSSQSKSQFKFINGGGDHSLTQLRKSSDHEHNAGNISAGKLKPFTSINQTTANFNAIIEQTDDNLKDLASATANGTFVYSQQHGDLNIKKQKTDQLKKRPKQVMLSTNQKAGDSSQQHESSIIDPYGASQGPKLFSAIYDEHSVKASVAKVAKEAVVNDYQQRQDQSRLLQKGGQSLLHQQNKQSSQNKTQLSQLQQSQSQTQQKPQQSILRRSYEMKFGVMQSKATHEAHRVNIDSPFFPVVSGFVTGRQDNRQKSRVVNPSGSQEALMTAKVNNTHKNNNFNRKRSQNSPRRNESQNSGSRPPMTGFALKQQSTQHQQLHALEIQKAAILHSRKASQLEVNNEAINMDIAGTGIQIGLYQSRYSKSRGSNSQDNNGPVTQRVTINPKQQLNDQNSAYYPEGNLPIMQQPPNQQHQRQHSQSHFNRINLNQLKLIQIP